MSSTSKSDSGINRRRFERFSLPAAYTEVKVAGAGGEWLSGHAYDVSEAGIRFELDEELPAGTSIRLRLSLPTGDARIENASELICEIEAQANVVWQDRDDVDGPVFLAAAFTGFANAGDRERLVRRVLEGRFRRAA